MGRLREEVLDPWGGVLAGVAGGLAWAVVPAGAVALPIGVGVAAAVYGVKVGLGMLTRREQAAPGPGPALRPPRRGGPADQWLRRAEAERLELADVARGCDPGTRAQLEPVVSGAEETVGSLRRLAAQVTAVEDALDRVPVVRLEADRDRLTQALAGPASDRLRAEWQRSSDSVTEQLAVAERLTEARDTTLARMQATVLTLEGLVARTAEVAALASTGGVDLSQDRLAGLTGDLDGLRRGIAEAEEVSRRVLGG